MASAVFNYLMDCFLFSGNVPLNWTALRTRMTELHWVAGTEVRVDEM
jgi:hypothetical protein